MNAINVLFSALFAAGAFAFVIGLTLREKIDLSELEKLSEGGERRPGLLPQLQHRLDTARLGVNAVEFLSISILLAFIVGAGIYLLSNAPLAGLVGFLTGGASYWVYLNHKVETALEAYENALPQVMARLVAGAQIGGSFEAAAQHVAEFGPENCREDWAYIVSQVKGGAPLSGTLDAVAERRGSLLLSTIFELLAIQEQRGASLSKTLEGLEESLRERVRVMRRARASMGGPIRELWIVCAIPFVIVIAMRLIAPGYAAVYGTLAGQFLLLVGWGITVLAFLAGYRSFSQGLREETNFGVLSPEARSDLAPVERPAQPPLAARRGKPVKQTAPSALSGALGDKP